MYACISLDGKQKPLRARSFSFLSHSPHQDRRFCLCLGMNEKNGKGRGRKGQRRQSGEKKIKKEQRRRGERRKGNLTKLKSKSQQNERTLGERYCVHAFFFLPSFYLFSLRSDQQQSISLTSRLFPSLLHCDHAPIIHPTTLSPTLPLFCLPFLCLSFIFPPCSHVPRDRLAKTTLDLLFCLICGFCTLCTPLPVTPLLLFDFFVYHAPFSPSPTYLACRTYKPIKYNRALTCNFVLVFLLL
jgi:hypothetical protein